MSSSTDQLASIYCTFKISVWRLFDRLSEVGTDIKRCFVFVEKETTTFWKCRKIICPKKVPKGSGYQRLNSSCGSHRNKRREITAGKTWGRRQKKEWKMSKVIMSGVRGGRSCHRIWWTGIDVLPADSWLHLRRQGRH